MIRKNQIFLNHINIFLDILIVLLSYVFSSWLYLDFFDGDLENIASISLKTILLAAAYSLMLFFILSMFGFYNTTRTRRLLWKIRTIIFSVTISTLITVALFFIFRLAEFSRGVIFVFYITTILLLVSKYAFMRKILRHFRERGYNLKHIIIIGTGKLARQYSEDLKEDAGLGFHIKGYIGKQDNDGISGQYLGSFEVIDTTLSSPDINEVVIALDPEEYEQIQSIIPICERNGVKYSVIPFYNDMIPAHPFIETIGRCKLINMRVNRLENLGWSILKRIFEPNRASAELITKQSS